MTIQDAAEKLFRDAPHGTFGIKPEIVEATWTPMGRDFFMSPDGLCVAGPDYEGERRVTTAD